MINERQDMPKPDTYSSGSQGAQRATAHNDGACTAGPHEALKPTDRARPPGKLVDLSQLQATETATIRQRPGYQLHVTESALGEPGLYYHGNQVLKSGELKSFDLRLCSELECVAATQDEHGENHGRLLRYKPLNGNWRQWSMPMEILAGGKEDLCRQLLRLGVRLNPKGISRLIDYLHEEVPSQRSIAATRTGWHTVGGEHIFVMPTRTIGQAKPKVRFQSDAPQDTDFKQQGTLEEWRATLGKMSSGNPLLMLAVSTALAGPLLELTHRKSCGLHFVGDSSSGKSTLLEVASSVWGSSSFLRTWKHTGNGLEGVATAHSCTVVVLDEIGEADSRLIGSTVYMLGNGTGKARACRDGSSRTPRTWQVAILSSGERTLAGHMQESGQSTMSGQSVRLLDISASRHFGAFDDLHRCADGREFADSLKQLCNQHYGTLGPAFIECLIESMQQQPDAAALLQDITRRESFRPALPMHGRAAQSFALIGMAGELATEFGLTGWKPGEVMQAAEDAFALWCEEHGQHQTEHQKALSRVMSFIQSHGDSRFSDHQQPAPHPVRDRAGYWTQAPNQERIYYFTSDGLKQALQGIELKRGLKALKEAGWIAVHEPGKSSTRLYIAGSRQRFYAISPRDEAMGGAS